MNMASQGGTLSQGSENLRPNSPTPHPARWQSHQPLLTAPKHRSNTALTCHKRCALSPFPKPLLSPPQISFNSLKAAMTTHLTCVANLEAAAFGII